MMLRSLPFEKKLEKLDCYTIATVFCYKTMAFSTVPHLARMRVPKMVKIGVYSFLGVWGQFRGACAVSFR
jgi:hypothetical protein